MFSTLNAVYHRVGETKDWLADSFNGLNRLQLDGNGLSKGSVAVACVAFAALALLGHQGTTPNNALGQVDLGALAPQCRIDLSQLPSYETWELTQQMALSSPSDAPASSAIPGLVSASVQGLDPQVTFSRNGTAFQQRIEQALNGDYKIIRNPARSTNQTYVLKMEGVSLAVLKTPPDWKEEFIREFNTDGFLGFPSVTRLSVPDKESLWRFVPGFRPKIEYQAIEFLQGATLDYTLQRKMGHARGILFDFLDQENLMTALEQRQRIYLLDWIVDNNDRHERSIMVGCEQVKIVLHPIDHDCTMQNFWSRMDFTSSNPEFAKSTLSQRNKFFLHNLNFEGLDVIFNKYQMEIKRDASTFTKGNRIIKEAVKHDNGFASFPEYAPNPDIPRVDAMKIRVVLLKIAAELNLQIKDMWSFLEKAVEGSVEAYSQFGFRTGASSREIEGNIRDWVTEHRFVENAIEN